MLKQRKIKFKKTLLPKIPSFLFDLLLLLYKPRYFISRSYLSLFVFRSVLCETFYHWYFLFYYLCFLSGLKHLNLNSIALINWRFFSILEYHSCYKACFKFFTAKFFVFVSFSVFSFSQFVIKIPFYCYMGFSYYVEYLRFFKYLQYLRRHDALYSLSGYKWPFLFEFRLPKFNWNRQYIFSFGFCRNLFRFFDHNIIVPDCKVVSSVFNLTALSRLNLLLGELFLPNCFYSLLSLYLFSFVETNIILWFYRIIVFFFAAFSWIYTF